MIFVGNDWAEGYHHVYLMDERGARLGFGRLPEGIDGVARFHQMVGEHTSDAAKVVVGIETDRGLWVGALISAGYRVYAINPMAVSRYRDRHGVAGAKSDRGDAKMLADLVRTDRHNHRPVAGDSPEAERIKIVVRTHQNLIWARTRHTNGVRNTLREYYPAGLETFDDLADRDTLAVLGRAPTPSAGARLTLPQIRAALKAAGERRNLDAVAGQIQQGLRTDHLTAPGPGRRRLRDDCRITGKHHKRTEPPDQRARSDPPNPDNPHPHSRAPRHPPHSHPPTRTRPTPHHQPATRPMAHHHPRTGLQTIGASG